MEPVDATILEKIRRVAAYTQSSNANEAAVAAAKLTEMLLKYNLQQSDIPGEKAPDDPFARTTEEHAKLPEWEITLSGAIARANLCTIVISGSNLVWMGRTHNLEIAQYINHTVKADITHLCDSMWLAIREILVGQDNVINGRTWKASFYAGAASEIKKRLAVEVDDLRQADDNMNAMIVVNDKALEQYKHSQFPNLGYHSGGRATAHGGAFGLGQQAGKSVSFRTGVGAGGSAAQRRIGG